MSSTKRRVHPDFYKTNDQQNSCPLCVRTHVCLWFFLEVSKSGNVGVLLIFLFTCILFIQYRTVSSLSCFNGHFGNLNWRYLHIRGLCKDYEIEYPHKYGLKNGTVASILGSWNSQWYIIIIYIYKWEYIYMYTYIHIWYVYLHMCLPWCVPPHQYYGYSLHLWGLGARCSTRGRPELRRAARGLLGAGRSLGGGQIYHSSRDIKGYLGILMG